MAAPQRRCGNRAGYVASCMRLDASESLLPARAAVQRGRLLPDLIDWLAGRTAQLESGVSK